MHIIASVNDQIVNYRIDAEQKLGALSAPLSRPMTGVIHFKMECFLYPTTRKLGKGETCVFLALKFIFIIL